MLGPEEKLQEYVDALDDEQVIAFYSTCNETNKGLCKARKEAPQPARDRAAQLTQDLIAYMDGACVDCLPLGDGTYVRRGLKASSKSINAKNVHGAVNKLRDPGARAVLFRAVVDERNARLEAWEAKQKKARRGKLGVAALVTAGSPPPEPALRFAGPTLTAPRRYVLVCLGMSCYAGVCLGSERVFAGRRRRFPGRSLCGTSWRRLCLAPSRPCTGP